MKKALFTLVILCTTSLIPELAPDTSALQDIDSRGFRDQKKNLSLNSKISPKLTKVLNKMADIGISRNIIQSLNAEDLSTSLVKVDNAGNIEVYVHLSEFSDENLKHLNEMGLISEVINENLKIVQGWLPFDSIEKTTELGFVSKITPPSYGHTREGSITSEGDGIMGSDEARDTFGVDGSGIKVGVISDGVDSMAASQMTGDLPDSIQVGDPGSGDEGTAELEIVHDIAPGADLAFHNGTTTLNFIDAIDYFRNNGVDVIIDDIGFLDEPFFQDGSVAQAAAQAVEDGIIFVSAAGNDRDRHYQAHFLDTDPADTENELHDFGLAAGKESDFRMNVEVPPLSSSVVVLQWTNPFGEASDDYDLFLFDSNTADIIDSGTDVQNGDDDPIEIAGVENPDDTETLSYDIVINKFSGDDQTLEIFFNLDGSPTEFNVPENSVYGHPAAPGVIAVGAMFNDDVDFFSSEGPSSIFFSPTVTISSVPSERAAPLLEDRQTPTIVAPNRVSTSVPGFFNFAGTSAAAPHVAGVAALVLQALGVGADIASSNAEDSGLVAARQVQEVTDILTGTADDISPAGFDNLSGFGSINAFAAVEEAINDNGGPQPTPPPGNNNSDGGGGCSIYGPASAVTSGTEFANSLILLIPVFVTALSFLKRRKQ